MIEIPAKQKPETGAVIVLHGWGANQHDLVSLVAEIDLPTIRYVFLEGKVDVPGTGGMGKGWFTFPPTEHFQKERDESRRQILSAIKTLKDGGIKGDRIVLMGFSQGAAMSLDIALHKSADSQIVGAVVSMSGFFMGSETGSEKSEQLNKIPIFAAHGTFDPLIPLEMGKKSLKALKEAGFPVHWHEYPMAHQVVMDEIADIKQFLTKTVFA